MILKQSFHQWLYDQEFKLKNGRTICINGIYRVVTEEYLDPWTNEFYLEYRILMANEKSNC